MGVKDDTARGQERFLLRNRSDIVAVLRQLARRPELVTAHFNQGKESFVTAVLAVDLESGTVDLDQGPDPAINRRALASDGLVCSTKDNNVSINFRVGALAAIQREDGPAFRAALPDGLYRLQRREFFRVPMPVSNPVICRIRSDDGEAQEFRAMDLSLGGLGIVDARMQLQLRIGDTLPASELLIPEQEPVAAVMEVRNISRHLFRDGSVGRRIGLAFQGLQPQDETLLQRYLQRLQIAYRESRPDR